MKTLTIVSVFNRDYLGHVGAAYRTQAALPFRSGLLAITGNGMGFPPRWVVGYDERLNVPEADSYMEAYQDIIGRILPDIIQTDFVLTVHNDGYARNPDRWTDEFLEYDYVGAPWITTVGGYRVGNGGFSLRSQKFLQCQKLCPPRGTTFEDIHFCNHCRPLFESFGCRFAPIELALRFSLEHACLDFPDWDPRMSFGYHEDKRPSHLRFPQ